MFPFEIVKETQVTPAIFLSDNDQEASDFVAFNDPSSALTPPSGVAGFFRPSRVKGPCIPHTCGTRKAVGF